MSVNMKHDDLEEFWYTFIELESDEVNDFLEISKETCPPEKLSLIHLIFSLKQEKVQNMDQSLLCANQAAAVALSDRNSVARLNFPPDVLVQRTDLLLRAVQLGFADILDFIMEISSATQHNDPRMRELLHEACEAGEPTVVRALLRHGCDPNARNARNEPALIVAAWGAQDEIVQILLESEADIEIEDPDGDSALHSAAYRGYESTARILLEAKARPAVCGGSGHTPLQWALNRGHTGVADILLEYGAMADLADDTRVPLSDVANGSIFEQIEMAQEIIFPASLTRGWLDHMRFVVAADKGSPHDIELIEPGSGATMTEPYIAISYCWGRTWNTEDPLLIQVPSRNRPGSNEVRTARASREVLVRSLEYAKAKGVRRIWIDQECIHQDDDEDKKNALQNMHLVYSQAQTTLVLLGRHVRAVPDINYLGERFLTVGVCTKLKADITSDRWFTRVWTCQEFGVTPTENLRYLVGWDKDLDREGNRWDLAAATFNLSSKGLRQNVCRSWEFSHREIGNISFHGEQAPHVIGLLTEIGLTGNAGEDRIAYTLAHKGIEDMYWWKHGLRFDFGVTGVDSRTNMVLANLGNYEFPDRHQEWPNLRMRLLSALSIQRGKFCTVFSDKLAILGNMTGYPFRLHPSVATQKHLSFSACALAMALYNGDLSPLFTDDLAFLDKNNEPESPQRSVLSRADLYSAADGRSAHTRCQTRIMTGSKCLSLGGKLLVEGLLWRVTPFTQLVGLNKKMEPIAADDSRDPIRFHFLQVLLLRLIALERIDLLEIVVTSVMQRQLASPLELVYILNDLQAWSRNEQVWPARVFEESFLEQRPAGPGIKVKLPNGSEINVLRYVQEKETKGMNYAMAELESDKKDPQDLLTHIHHSIVHGLPLALGECEIGGQTLVSLFSTDPCQYPWILTPANELDYEFGQNAWLHQSAKDTFWCIKPTGQLVPEQDMSKAADVLGLNAGREYCLSREVLEVITSGTRSHFKGIWSPRLSRVGFLEITDNKTWNQISLTQDLKYVSLI